MAPVVTILGSCRQSSIGKNFQLTDIHEELTLPHYSKETLQCIRFLKNPETFQNGNHAIRYSFRSGLLDRRSIPSETIAKLRKQFEETDIFVIEIASRLAYQQNDLYMHHIIVEPGYGCMDQVKSIVIRSQPDEEIEEDILEIVKELSPKPILFVSHISTYSQGKRYDLIQFLKETCLKHNLNFFDPTTLLSSYSEEELLVPERVISHFTPYGHSILAEEYKRLINNILTI
jgi:hypothetical protein